MSNPKDLINIRKVLKAKNPKLYRWLPGFVFRMLENLICQDKLNYFAHKYEDLKGMPKLNAFVNHQGIRLIAHGLENLPKDKQYIFVGNHPLGGPDGIMLMVAVYNHFGSIKMLANDVLLQIPDMEDVFVAVNKYGAQGKDRLQAIQEAYMTKSPMTLFPAGLVSRKINGVITDLPWKPTFIKQAIKYERDVIPVFIDSVNSNFFYNLANFRKRIGLKINIEMFFLIKEMFKHTNEDIHLYFGEPIPYTKFDKSKSVNEWCDYVKSTVYSLK